MNRWNLSDYTRARAVLTRRCVLGGAAALCCLPASAFAAPPIISALEAQAAMESGDLVVLDIRSRAEWRETGLAKGAWPVSMHEADFPAKLNAILAKFQPSQIALICATGGRTSYIADVLEQNGITGVTDISEGMMGNARGPGWIARGLPIATLQQAQSAADAALDPGN